MLRRPVALVGLTAAGDAEGVGGDILRDHAAGGDICSLTDRDRCNQSGVTADKGAVLHGGLMLLHPVKVDRCRAAAEIAVVSDQRIAEIGQVRCPGVITDLRIFDLNKLPIFVLRPISESGRMCA